MEFEKIYKKFFENDDKYKIICRCIEFTENYSFEKSLLEYTVENYREFVNNFPTYYKPLTLDYENDLVNIIPLLETIFDSVKSIVIIKGTIPILKINNKKDKSNYAIVNLDLLRSILLKRNRCNFLPYSIVVTIFVVGFIMWNLLEK